MQIIQPMSPVKEEPARERSRPGCIVAAIVVSTLFLTLCCFGGIFYAQHNFCFSLLHATDPSPVIQTAGDFAVVNVGNASEGWRIADGKTEWREADTIYDDSLLAD